MICFCTLTTTLIDISCSFIHSEASLLYELLAICTITSNLLKIHVMFNIRNPKISLPFLLQNFLISTCNLRPRISAFHLKTFSRHWMEWQQQQQHMMQFMKINRKVLMGQLTIHKTLPHNFVDFFSLLFFCDWNDNKIYNLLDFFTMHRTTWFCNDRKFFVRN